MRYYEMRFEMSFRFLENTNMTQIVLDVENTDDKQVWMQCCWNVSVFLRVLCWSLKSVSLVSEVFLFLHVLTREQTLLMFWVITFTESVQPTNIWNHDNVEWRSWTSLADWYKRPTPIICRSNGDKPSPPASLKSQTENRKQRFLRSEPKWLFGFSHN